MAELTGVHEVLRRLVDLAPWREESVKLDTHQLIRDDAENASTGRHDADADTDTNKPADTATDTDKATTTPLTAPDTKA